MRRKWRGVRVRSLQELEDEKQCRLRAQKSEAQVLLQYQLAKTECERMKSELKKLREQYVIILCVLPCHLHFPAD